MRGALDDDAEDTGEGEVLVFAASEASPYADVNPDRRAAMSRMATLFHLAHERPWSVLVVPASALARKVVPRKELARRADRIVAEQELDRDALVRSLSEAGYLRVPVVEDPGSFAVRGALLDVWPPSSETPVRVELYGELVLVDEAVRPDRADDEEGRARAQGSSGCRPCARPSSTGAPSARARERVTQLAEAIDWPTTKTRALVDDVVNGRAFFGAEGYLPAYYDELDPLLAYVPDDAVVVLDDPPGDHARRARGARARDGATRRRRRARRRRSCRRRSTGTRRPSPRDLGGAPVVALHRTPVVGRGGGRARRLRERARPARPRRRATTTTSRAR